MFICPLHRLICSERWDKGFQTSRLLEARYQKLVFPLMSWTGFYKPVSPLRPRQNTRDSLLAEINLESESQVRNLTGVTRVSNSVWPIWMAHPIDLMWKTPKIYGRTSRNISRQRSLSTPKRKTS